MKTSTIYKCVNKVNGKIYIGYTIDFENRKMRHIKDSFNSKHSSYNHTFHKALRKYGIESFEWCVLYQSLDIEHCRKTMENYFIEEYRSYVGFPDCNGYNLTLGGEGMSGFMHSDVSRKKMSKSAKGKKKPPRTTEHQIKLGLSRKGKPMPEKCIIAQRIRCTGTPLSDNHKKAISDSMGNYYEIKSPSGEIFNIKNLNEFCRNNNLNRGHMASVGRGEATQHKGWSCRKIKV